MICTPFAQVIYSYEFIRIHVFIKFITFLVTFFSYNLYFHIFFVIIYFHIFNYSSSFINKHSRSKISYTENYSTKKKIEIIQVAFQELLEFFKFKIHVELSFYGCFMICFDYIWVNSYSISYTCLSIRHLIKIRRHQSFYWLKIFKTC